MEAGAWKVICEARESGKVGLYFGTGEVRTGLIDEITENIDDADLIFEAPQKSQQSWLIRKLGSEVNIGNVSTHDVLGLETLRLGLRGDTMAQFHPVENWNARPEHQDLIPARPKRRASKPPECKSLCKPLINSTRRHRTSSSRIKASPKAFLQAAA